MFWIRTLSGFVLCVLSFVLIHFGGMPLAIFVMALSLIGFYEMVKALGLIKRKKDNILVAFGFLAIVVYYAFMVFKPEMPMMMVMTAVLTIIIFLTLYVLTFPHYNSHETMSCVFAFLYAPVMLSFMPLTRELPHGKYIVWMIYIASWGYDTSAYCVGMLTSKLFGNHKAFPKLSPKKSIEGCIGGIIGAAAIAWVYGHFLVKEVMVIDGLEWILAGIAAIGAVIAQIGDLAASAVKRDRNIKDYGKCIPGHGGVLDRFDSMIFVAPIIYFLCILFIQSKL